MNKKDGEFNRLENSKSPYLKLHKSNPIDWYPWEDEALLRAVKEDKLIFLSIGYSSCKWCHTMNRECFQNEEVAKILNENYISIKVDKEERPDIDKLYMLFAEALTGITGWPLNIILTPERIPVYSGNYMTVDGSENDIGIKEVLENVNNNWKYRREEIVKKSNYILRETNKLYNTYTKGSLNRDIFDRTRNEIYGIYDWENGGYYESPKFLLPQYSMYLFRYHMMSKDEKSLKMAKNNLDSLYKGAIFDHIGGGFFRYSTDEGWNKPHFEKMLGENSLMGILYALGYQATNDDFYKEISNKIFKFMIRDMMSDEGAFYTSINAEFQGEEGKYYKLISDEIIELLGEEVAGIYLDNYNGDNEDVFIPHLKDIDRDLLKRVPLESINDMLYEYRLTKGSPNVDKKVLASMNGLVAGAMAYSGKIFDDNLLLVRAKNTMDFLIEHMISDDYEISPIYMEGEAYGEGLLLDYSYILFGLINIYLATDENKYLEIAKKVSLNVKKHFWNEETQALYLNSIDKHDLILDLKDNNDGSVASSSGVMAYNWVKLYKITGDRKYYSHYRNMINSYSGDIISSPNAHIYSIISMFYI